MARIARLYVSMLLAIPGVAKAAEPPCLTASEFSSLAGYALPSVINGTTKRCSATLGAKSFLKTNGSQLSSRYAAQKGKAWPGAKAAFIKLSAKSDKNAYDVFTKLSDESLQEMLDVILEGMVGEEIPPERCGTIDNLVRLLSPLPPENTAELITLAVGLASGPKEGKVGKIAICPS